MSFSNFVKGALDRMPDGLDFAQSVHRGQLANEKMGMERVQFENQNRQFENQNKQFELEYGLLEEENRLVDPAELAARIAKNSDVAKNALTNFFTTLAGPDGKVRQKYLQEGFKYINDPATTEQLYAEILAEYQGKVAKYKADLNSKPASGGIGLSPEQRAYAEAEINKYTNLITNLQQNSPQYRWGETHKLQQEQLEHNKKIDWAKIGLGRAELAIRKKNNDMDFGDKLSLTNKINDNVNLRAMKYREPDENGKLTGRIRVYDTVNGVRQPARPASDDEEEMLLNQWRREEYVRMVQQLTGRYADLSPVPADYSQFLGKDVGGLPPTKGGNAPGGVGPTVEGLNKDKQTAPKNDVLPPALDNKRELQSGFDTAFSGSAELATGLANVPTNFADAQARGREQSRRNEAKVDAIRMAKAQFKKDIKTYGMDKATELYYENVAKFEKQNLSKKR